MPRQCENCNLWAYMTASCQRTTKAPQIWVPEAEAKASTEKKLKIRWKSKEESNLRQKKEKHRFGLHLEG
ncbi:hypothetical protein Ancab_006461, partial [Ancistrocladus abbreviatus]